MRHHLTYLLVWTALSATACGDQLKKDEDKADFTVSSLEGLWSVSCVPSQLGQISGYRIAAIQIAAGGGFTYESTHYEDKACTVKLYDESSKGTVLVADAVDEIARRIELTPSEGSGIPRHDAVVTAFNFGACGFKDWAIDVAKNLMDSGCIGWSEVTDTDGVSLANGEDGKIHMQVFSFGSDSKSTFSGDDFVKN